MDRMIKLFILIFLNSSFSWAGFQCHDLFIQTTTQSHSVTKSNINNLKQELINAPVSDFLTEEFILSLQDKIGPITKSVKYKNTKNYWHQLKANLNGDLSYYQVAKMGYENFIEFRINSADFNVMKFYILVSKDMSTVSVENLNLRNPLNENTSFHLSQTQSKGISIKDFVKSVKYVKGVLKKHGAQMLVANAQNLLVSFLYRRVVGLQAAEKSAQVYKYFDRLLLTKILSTDELNRALGDVSGDGNLQAISEYYKLGTVTRDIVSNLSGVVEVYDEGNIIGYKFDIDGISRHLILDPYDKNKNRFLTWENLFTRSLLGLEMNLQQP